ncbi:unnamed protein product [Blepharisma stoltei]|uniref:RRM domain-containing protein n=1 Tax=Blepharisma stoltei TaxID=1481888 RepID=A0AAU9IP94_9CILI|nr:unnamed protein product [Blepharisma stoltei]
MSLPIFIKSLRRTLFRYSGFRYASTSIKSLQDNAFQSFSKRDRRFERKNNNKFELDKKSAKENSEMKEESKEIQSEANKNVKDGKEDKPAKKDKYFSVFVGNLSWDAKEEHVESLFLPYGKPIWISFLKDNETGYSKGAAFVKYKDEKKALASLELNGKVHMERTLQVNMASDKEALEKHKAMIISRTSSTIYVSNLPYKLRDENSFRELFSKCGKIVKVTFPKDEDGKYLHYGFVEFARPQSAKIALGIKNPMYGGRKLRIKLAELKEENNYDE